MPPLLLLLFSCAFSGLLSAQSPKRYALVIGNGQYTTHPLGQTPANDAKAVAAALRLANFEVDVAYDLSLASMNATIRRFGEKVRNSGAVAVVYFSGHGLQYSSHNYLVPTDADLSVPQDIKGYCVPVDRIVSYLQGTTTNILILDACRSYPIPGDKSILSGLAKETFDDAPAELVIAYATGPNATSTTIGERGMSLYTSQLVKYLNQPCLSIEDVFKRTRADVRTKSNQQQRPEESNSLISDFHFMPPCAPEVVPVRPDPVVVEKRPELPLDALDTDVDGVPDSRDPCPNDYGTANGCPDYDNDGVADKSDRCRTKAGPPHWQGCPDSDGDTLPDHEDDCPDEAGPTARKGCPLPDPDRDRDGTPDDRDACPDNYGPATLSGCPDSDGDGVVDKSDKCPTEPGVKHLQGCPEPKPPSPNFVLIKGGTYTMGDQFSEGAKDEQPHTVTVSDFYLSKYEVTFREYDAFCAATGRDKPSDSSWGRGERPVINVSWYDAIEYCNWLSQQQGRTPYYTIDKSKKDPNNISSDDDLKWKITRNPAANGYRLPTEAEWEYAAREGGKKVRFGNGSDIIKPSEVNFDASESYKKNYSVAGEYRQKTVPVQELKSNALGLYHMSGNVWEWCWDWYGDNYFQDEGVRNPLGATSGSERVVRGGSWFYYPYACRNSDREDHWPWGNSNFIGFRLACAPQ
jgi:formylglycine-generating enzyme required for sulfatase activity